MTTEKPALQDAKIVDCLHEHYGLQVGEITFLPSGDMNVAAYRVVTEDQTPYFLKLRRGVFAETSVTVPYFLSECGIWQIIAPIMTRSRQLWAHLDDFTVLVYPFVQGHNAFEFALSEHQWVDFGSALKAIHTAVVPPELSSRVQHETYSPQWRDRVKKLQALAQKEAFEDPIAIQLAQFLTAKAEEILYLVGRAEQLSSVLQAQEPESVLCHSDVHAGNLLIEASGRLYIVDWDNPIMAPKERDLMFVGGGVGSIRYSAREENLFYKGYGRTQINPVALAYYRFERIVQDIAEWGELLLLTNAGGKDRARSLQGFARWFQPNDVVEMAYKAEKTLPLELQ